MGKLKFIICNSISDEEVILIAPIIQDSKRFKDLNEFSKYVVDNKYAVIIKNIGGKNDNIEKNKTIASSRKQGGEVN